MCSTVTLPLVTVHTRFIGKTDISNNRGRASNGNIKSHRKLGNLKQFGCTKLDRRLKLSSQRVRKQIKGVWGGSARKEWDG